MVDCWFGYFIFVGKFLCGYWFGICCCEDVLGVFVVEEVENIV